MFWQNKAYKEIGNKEGMSDDEEWEEKGFYLGYKLLAKGKKRRVIDEETGEIIVEYEMDE